MLRNSKSHNLLLAAASLDRAKREITAANVMEIVKCFDKPGRFLESARHLMAHGLLVQVDESSWRITTAGKNALYDLTERRSRRSDSGRPARYQVK